jgi:hypothetical protein
VTLAIQVARYTVMPPGGEIINQTVQLFCHADDATITSKVGQESGAWPPGVMGRDDQSCFMIIACITLHGCRCLSSVIISRHIQIGFEKVIR